MPKICRWKKIKLRLPQINQNNIVAYLLLKKYFIQKMINKKVLFGLAALIFTACFNVVHVSASVGKVLFVGDSLTFSGTTPDVGWYGNYGMAAISADKDYAHLLYAKISSAQASPPSLTIHGSYNGKIAGVLSSISSLTSVGADLVILQIGENDIDLSPGDFEAQYQSLASALKGSSSNVRLFCTSAWKDSAARGSRDGSINSVCQKNGGIFVDISGVANNPAYSALAEGHFTHAGVNWHPGDAGMQAYADTLWAAILSNPDIGNPVTPTFSANKDIIIAPGDVTFTITNGTGCINYECKDGVRASIFEYEKSFSCHYAEAGSYTASISCAGTKITKAVNVTSATTPTTPSFSADRDTATAPADINFTLTNGAGCINYNCSPGVGAQDFVYEHSFKCHYAEAGSYTASIECGGVKKEKVISITSTCSPTTPPTGKTICPNTQTTGLSVATPWTDKGTL
ncbi:MAG: SGNH/GDSL hydrolase family protein, partial [Chloroflexota bacterium]